MGEGTRPADRQQQPVMGLWRTSSLTRGILHPPRRSGGCLDEHCRKCLGLLLHPAHRRRTRTKRHLLLRPHLKIRHEAYQSHLQQAPCIKQGITEFLFLHTHKSSSFLKGLLLLFHTPTSVFLTVTFVSISGYGCPCGRIVLISSPINLSFMLWQR